MIDPDAALGPAAEPGPVRASVPVLASLLKFALGVALLASIVVLVAPPWHEIRGRITLSVPMLGVSLAGSLVATIVTAARWKLLSEAMGAAALPYGVYFHWLALTRVVAQFLPTLVVDVVGRTAALKAAGSPSRVGQLIAPVLLERLLDLLLPLAMIGWAIAVATDALPISPWLSLAFVTLLIAAVAVPALVPLAALALRIYAWLLARRRRSGADPAALPPGVVTRPLAARIVALALARYFSVALQYWGAGAGFGVTLPALVLLSAAPAAMAAGLVGVTPGGLGFQEGGWAAALSQLGQDGAAVVVFMTATRLMMIVNFGLLAVVSWPWRTARPTRAPVGDSDP